MKLKMKLVGAVCAIGLIQSASALTVVGNSVTNLATEYLSTAAVTLNNIGFNASTQGVVSNNAVQVRVSLSSGTFGVAACGTFTQVDTVNAAINSTPAWIATGGGTSTCTYSQAAANVTVNTTAANTFFRLVGATASSFTGLIASGTNDNGCAFTTGIVTLTARYFDNSGTNVDVETRAATDARLLAANPNAKLDTAVIVTAQQAITGAFTPAADSVVDIRGTSPAGTRFVVPTSSPQGNSITVPIGTVKFLNTDGVQNDNTGAADYVLVGAANGTVTVALKNSVGSIPTGTSFTMVDITTPGATCVAGGVAAVAGSGTVTGTDVVLNYPAGITALGTTSATFVVCMTIPTNLAASVPQLSFTGYAKVDRSAPAAVPFIQPDFAGGPTCLTTLNKLTYNAGLIEIRNYVPAVQNNGGAGWQSFIRIINAGATATPINGYFVSDTGVQGSTSVIVTSIPARGNVTVSNTAIEVALGAAPAGQNPRLVLLANTDVLRVQNYIRQPGGFWIEASSGQDDGTNASGSNR